MKGPRDIFMRNLYKSNGADNPLKTALSSSVPHSIQPRLVIDISRSTSLEPLSVAYSANSELCCVVKITNRYAENASLLVYILLKYWNIKLSVNKTRYN